MWTAKMLWNLQVLSGTCGLLVATVGSSRRAHYSLVTTAQWRDLLSFLLGLPTGWVTRCILVICWERGPGGEVSLDGGASPSLSRACTPWHLFTALWQVFTGVGEHLGLLPLHKFSPSSLVPPETPGTSSDWAPWGFAASSGLSQAGALLLASGGHLAACYFLSCFHCFKFLSSCLFSHFYFKSFTF